MTRSSLPIAFILPDMRGGGAERVALEVIQSLVEAGHKVDLVLQNAEGDLLPLLAPEVRVVDLKVPRLRNTVRPLARYFRAERPVAVQASMWPLTIVSLMAQDLSGLRTNHVVSEHTVLSSQYGGRGAAQNAAMRASLALFYRRASARIAVSRGVADDLARLSGMPRDKIDVIYNPIRLIVPTADARTAGEGLWGDRPGQRILTVGSLKKVKNQLLLIQSFALLRAAVPATLVILGQGEELERLRAEARTLGVADDVHFPGFLSDPAPAYASADLFVLSSDYEGYGNVIVEALQWGLAVVSTDCPSGPSEILAGGTFGTLVPCRDAPALAAAMTAALRRPVDKSMLQERAKSLSGDSAIAAYFAILGLDPPQYREKP